MFFEVLDLISLVWVSVLVLVWIGMLTFCAD